MRRWLGLDRLVMMPASAADIGWVALVRTSGLRGGVRRASGVEVRRSR